MPTYEYRCKDCGTHLEVVQSFRDDPLTECPRCAGPLRKVFGSIGIAFKGTGFYRTDSRSPKVGSSAGAGSSSGSDGAGTSSSGSGDSGSGGSSSDASSSSSTSSSSSSSSSSSGGSGTEARSA